jgi:phosphomannomutase
VAELYIAAHGWKRRSVSAYTLFAREIVTGKSDLDEQENLLEEMAEAVTKRPLGILAEFNGSARSLSIDVDFLGGIGLRVATLNDRPRAFAHRIVPEGESLEPARAALAAAHAGDEAFVAGYVPDCDGDRGNVVWYDWRQKCAKVLEAQQVFSLCVLSELAGLSYFGLDTGRVAVVCNDPTSLRIDAIARAFGAKVFRAEVGEANVVGLARQLRSDGWTVRILGEGSNGGNITYPGAVRDPMSTLGSLIKLLQLKSVAGTPGLFERWCRASGQPEAYSGEATLADILATLPVWTTTSADEERAVLRIKSTDHARFKAAFEREFQADWPQWHARLEQELGVTSWSEVNYEGVSEKPGFGPAMRSGRQTGGLKILLQRSSGETAACLWMRGSGTEPVFRVAVDVEGDRPAHEALLLGWLTELVVRADQG